MFVDFFPTNPGANSATADFEYDSNTHVFKIQALTQTTEVQLPPPKDRYVPLAGCQGVTRETIKHRFVICALYGDDDGSSSNSDVNLSFG